MVGEQALPVRSEAAAPETRNTRLVSRAISVTASATDEVGTSTITSTSSTSIHWRTMLEPMSALFWWSADSTSTLAPMSPTSSTAMRAASTEPCPARSAYRPDWSFITPILTAPPEISACAAPLSRAIALTQALKTLMLMPLPFASAARALPYTPRYSCSWSMRSSSLSLSIMSTIRPCSIR